MMLLALLLSLANGWEAKVHFTHDPPRRSGGADGKIHLQGGRVRLEEPTPMGATVIVAARGKVLLLFPETRQFFEIDPAAAALATVPPPSLEGMRVVGRETVDGRDCRIWERALETPMGTIRQRLWVPEAASKKNNFFFLRVATVTPRGATRADLSELRFRRQPEALFRLPAGYKRK